MEPLDQFEAYAKARKIAREWLTKFGAPAAVNRRMTGVITSALMRGTELCPIAIETIGRECVRAYINGATKR